MMFVPFTGIDNHNRNVTLGAAIIGNETAETYSWLLKVFREAFGRARLVIVTDQDPAMKKVGATICNSTDFKKRLCAIVWTDSILPEKFELNLSNQGYLDTGLLSRGVHVRAYAYLISFNHFFGQFCNPECTLVEFFRHFDYAIEAQRHKHRKNDHDTTNTNADIWVVDFVLEDQAANIYTRTIFFDQPWRYKIVYTDVLSESGKIWVMIREDDMTMYCTCKRFEQFGLLCSHIFCVLRMLDIREFPQCYILRRWTREVVPNSALGAILGINECEDRYNEVNCVVHESTYSTESVINRLVANFDVLSSFRDHVVNYFKTANETVVNAPHKSRRESFAKITGNTQPSNVTVHVPVGTRYKGLGKPKRMKSKREIAISQLGKKSHQCQNCFRYEHNRCTCKNPTRTKEQAMAEEDGEEANEVDKEEDEWEEVEEALDEQDEDESDEEDGEEDKEVI
ncbi:protein FAR1-RELATED SEQUENCE 7-like [Helianthus annuus]|uniref:protein FAR1-RELATED SEQUENCE 7-like n=1 Tax=Helianthus annuus TaxID=4232 RepID=UPI000B8FA09C|nr:protein FAR1-RELATED SEQUENCE 7-like [Helianthus annuus]